MASSEDAAREDRSDGCKDTLTGEELKMNNQTLGTIGVICAPALFVGGLLAAGTEDPLIMGIASMVFMLGWICSNTAMRRLRATGTSLWGRAVLGIQLVGLVLAFLFGLFEATGLFEGTVVFAVTDAAWPLSMLWMLVVGVTAITAGRFAGWRRFVMVLCPFWLLVAIVGSIALGPAGEHVGAGFSAVMWILLGLAVRDDAESVGAAPEPAVQP